MSDFQIKVVAFGIARDIMGGKQLELVVQEGATVSIAMSLLKEKFPAFEQLTSLNLAINEEYVNGDYQIKSGDELVLIPPVSGG
ncbi:molybdopterin synthase sulfur carrier subunit [Reichenbachiella faecimaris]|uniref:Molybdopterin synthase sulfur carrier subunit n=1 Tax=Reichenbachiella faecimaris TaxID=692418 RepID=A0A1W2G7W5_REIFA|nr:MoaD/ThiS family protein [Reichenbachiella faecimaris]SMD32701.1 molybdopterin synthase sulfur carrier subunit [Reichenbachiella faecimaris]